MPDPEEERRRRKIHRLVTGRATPEMEQAALQAAMRKNIERGLVSPFGRFRPAVPLEPPPFFQTFEEQQAAFAPTAGLRQESFQDILTKQAGLRQEIAGIQEKTRPIAGVIPGGTTFGDWAETWNLP